MRGGGGGVPHWTSEAYERSARYLYVHVFVQPLNDISVL